MSYNAVAQAADEVASHSSSDLSRSPSPTHGTFQQLHAADHLEGSQLASAQTSDKAGLDLASMIRSMTSTSYDVVEDDDYDADPSHDQPSNSLRAIPPLNTAIARHSSPEPPLHSASSDIPPPLNHPTPDLQSLQGAYSGNVERLEMTAERLSCSSTDIGSEIRKMDQEQKRRSCSSASNSIIMRNGAFSPVTVSSAHGSTFSTRQRSVSGASRLPQVTEPDHDENVQYADHLPTPLPILPAPQPQIYSHTSEVYYNQPTTGNNGPEDLERPASAASGDTFHQARTLFNDFDGVHFTPLERAESGRHRSLIQPPLASKPESYKAPQAGDQMVYYPAPVPRMLNLPPKLSRRPISDHEKRRTQLMNSIAAEDKLAEQEKSKNIQKDKGQSTVPQQLRASVFFDPPSAPLDVQVKQDSAVATLDSILDASTYAPVSAFTDHPFAGHIGSQVYGNSKRKTLTKIPPGERPERNSQNLMGQSQSQEIGEGSTHPDDGVHQHSDHHRSQDERSGSEIETDSHDSEDGEEESEEEEDYVGPPNTLLAELQLRKHELKQRTRTAVPTAAQAQGMGATLLEMDEMAQKQSEKRRRRPVTLAWDGHNNADDDDVPLAMLYPDKANVDDENQPVGLMAKRQMEENEPLSTRRARLRGEPIPEKRPVTVYSTMEVKPEKPKSEHEEENGNEAETLAERLRRLKGQNPEESDFTSGLMAEFDTRAGNAPKEAPKPSGSAPEQEETLAQRRNRLQRENVGNRQGVNPQNLHNRRSMAALPQSRPPYAARQSSYDVFPQQRGAVPQLGHRASMYSLPVNMASQGYPMAQQPSGYGMPYPSAYPYNNMGYPSTCGPTLRQPLEPAQQEVIDRWRQSIR
ncbi:hypothetical protein PENSTE_c007G05223 [Penicillium steckii]|uniref:Uncharacterized protein n=1 Tax=Penicillium steckii TaxID=303698 RepID=A0A1V6TE90_9EURO|nr:hypothetical protein PENSTE_c007G05223 [Penicillium steckii]